MPDPMEMFRAKKYNDKRVGSVGSLPPINQAINRSVGNSFDKSNPQKSTQYGQGNYNVTSLPTKQLKPASSVSKITTAQVKALENDPASLAKPYQLSRTDLSFNAGFKEAGDAIGYSKDNSFMWKGGEYTTEKAGQASSPPVRPDTPNVPMGGFELDMADDAVLEDMPDLMEVNQPSYADHYNRSRAYDTPEGFGKSVGDFDPSMKGSGLLNQSSSTTDILGMSSTGQKSDLGFMGQAPKLSPMAGSEAFRELPLSPDSGGGGSFKAMVGQMAGDAQKAAGHIGKGIGKLGEFAKGPGGKGIMAAASFVNDIQAMKHREDAMTGIGDTISKLEGAVSDATLNREAGFDAAMGAFQQKKGLLGKRLADNYKGVVKKTTERTLAGSGSALKARKDAKNQIANQGDEMLAGLENTLSSSKAQVMTQTRGDRSKAKSSMAEAELKLKQLKKEQGMAPLKMASNVVGMVNPAAGMALNAGLSLYDAYS